MNLQEILDAISLKALTEPKDYSTIQVECGYISDMLSCVVAGAKSHSLWVTLLAHNNIVAVASLVEVPAIIITENAQPDEATITKANDQGIALFSTPSPSFEIVGRLWELGLRET